MAICMALTTAPTRAANHAGLARNSGLTKNDGKETTRAEDLDQNHPEPRYRSNCTTSA